MSTVVNKSDVTAADVVKDRPAPWLSRVDEWCERLGDSLNPILVKETRQALKSRQFVITFSVLLVAALAWTIFGSLWMMPEIYTSPSAPPMLIGYYIVLAIPMLLVVPLAAYRSLEGEIDDGTLELLSITTLSPWQIVLGKLASATLQMALYFIALFPCFAYAYTLRGVDLPTTMGIISLLIVGASVLTIVALFFAPLSRGRTGRVSTLLAVLLILLVAEWGIGALVINLILYGNPLTAEWNAFLVTATLLISLSLGQLLLTATAAQLTPESENRSTHMRVALLGLSAVIVGLVAYAVARLGDEAIVILFGFAITLGAVWLLCGCLMASESPAMTPRIRRELPASFAARVLLTWLTPGPGTGLVFASICIAVLTGFTLGGISYYLSSNSGRGPAGVWGTMVRMHLLIAAYAIGTLCLVRFIVAVVRVNNNPRVEIGFATLIAVAVVLALVPYSIGLHANDYRSYSYSWWQLSNWVWTIRQAGTGGIGDAETSIILGVVTVLFAIALLSMPSTVLPRRVSTPQRVEEERAKQKTAVKG